MAPNPKPTESQVMAALEAQVKSFDSTIPRIVMSLYGDPGTGKTILAHQIAQAITPPNKKIITVDTSDSILALRQFPALKQRVVPIVYENITQFGYLIAAIANNRGSFANVGTIICDEMSSIADAAILALGSAREADGGNKIDEDTLDRRDYGTARNQVARRLSEGQGIRALKTVNVIMTAHSRKDAVNPKDENSLKITSMAYPAKIKLDIEKLSSLVGYCFQDITKVGGKDVITRKVQVDDSVVIKCKNRLGGFSGPIVSGQELVQVIVNFLRQYAPQPQPVTVSNVEQSLTESVSV